MKTFLIILGVLSIVGIILYFVLKKSKVTPTQQKEMGTSILDKIKAKNNTDNQNTGTEVVMPPVLTEPLGLTYEGQTIYAKRNGIAVGNDAIGYLADNSILYLKDVEYRDGEYKKKIEDVYNSDGVNTKVIVGIVPISNAYLTLEVTVYKYHKKLKIEDFPKGIGFNIQGLVVYKDTTDLGSLGKFDYYYY